MYGKIVPAVSAKLLVTVCIKGSISSWMKSMRLSLLLVSSETLSDCDIFLGIFFVAFVIAAFNDGGTGMSGLVGIAPKLVRNLLGRRGKKLDGSISSSVSVVKSTSTLARLCASSSLGAGVRRFSMLRSGEDPRIAVRVRAAPNEDDPDATLALPPCDNLEGRLARRRTASSTSHACIT
jgi:hypothetical protein